MSYWYLLICLTFLVACGGNPKRQTSAVHKPLAEELDEKVKYVNSIDIISPEKNSKYKIGEQLTVKFDCKKKFQLDSSVLYVNGKRIAHLVGGGKQFVLELSKTRVGYSSIKIIAYHPQNRQGIATLRILVLPDKAPIKCNYEIIKEYSHDKNAYTQGLVYKDGFMYESTGQYGESGIRKIDMKSLKVLSLLNIDSQYFGEGITIWDNKIYQITWHARKGFIYDIKTFSLIGSFDYNSEGWGITTMKDNLVMSDGTNVLYLISPEGFNVLKEVEVYDNNGPVNELNELEYIHGLVWANVWLTNRIVAIEPETGIVKYELDGSKLLSSSERKNLDDKDDVLNGIAWNPQNHTFYLTGKRWPKMFEIKVQGMDEVVSNNL